MNFQNHATGPGGLAKNYEFDHCDSLVFALSGILGTCFMRGPSHALCEAVVLFFVVCFILCCSAIIGWDRRHPWCVFNSLAFALVVYAGRKRRGLILLGSSESEKKHFIVRRIYVQVCL